MSTAAPLAVSDTRMIEDDRIPWVRIEDFEMKIFKVGREDGIYTMLNRLHPGFEAPRHLHLGWVHAYTLEGTWAYREYDWLATPGSYIYEPPDTIHTLFIPEDNPGPTTIFFTIQNGLELYDPDGNVFMKQDGEGMFNLYKGGLEIMGVPLPDCILP